MQNNTKANQNKLFKGLDNKIQRSKFDLSYKNRLSANFNKLIPTMCLDVMPKDELSLKTDFFSRWLTMLAPTFTDINLRFNSFYVHNSSIWKGWAQFAGEGDSLSSEYLLGHESRNGMKVPYFTTLTMARLLVSNLFDRNPNIEEVKALYPLSHLGLSPLMKQRYRLIFARSLVFATPPCNVAPPLRGSEPFGGYPHVAYCVYIARKENANVDALINAGYAVEVDADTSAVDLQRYAKFMQIGAACIYGKDFDLTYVERVAKEMLDRSAGHETTAEYKRGLELSTTAFEPFSFEDMLPVPAWMMRWCSTSGDAREGVISDILPFDISAQYDMSRDVENGWKAEMGDYLTSSSVYTLNQMGYYGDTICWSNTQLAFQTNDEVGQEDTHNKLILGYQGTGVLYNMETSQWEVRPNETNVAQVMVAGYPYVIEMDNIRQMKDCMNDNGEVVLQELLVRAVGQWFIRDIFGSGTLTDYLGLNLTQQVQWNNPQLAVKIMGKLIGGGAKDVALARKSSGTYLKDSVFFEVGVVNSEPISLLPYLAYKRCWNDLIRDPRFEEQDPYSNPYTSPFLSPLVDGSFINGNVFNETMVVDTSGHQRYTMISTPTWDTSTAPINRASSMNMVEFFKFFELRERRISKDFFSLVTPNSQWSHQAAADVDVNFDSGLPSSTSPHLLTNVGDSVQMRDSRTGASLGSVSWKGAVAVNALRLAGRIQQFLERNNIVGSDFVRQQIAHYSIAPEHRNEVAHYLGGDKFSPNISPVQMLGSDTETQQTGQLKGEMNSSGSACKIRTTIKEHGYVIQLLTIQNDYSYTTPLKKQFIDWYDYPKIEFANLAPEEVPLCSLINTDDSSSVDDDFTNRRRYGFAPRYWFAKMSQDEVHGDFKRSLSYWLSTRKLNSGLLGNSFGDGQTTAPVVGANMMYENPDYSAFTYQFEDYGHCLLDLKQWVSVKRSLPVIPCPVID